MDTVAASGYPGNICGTVGGERKSTYDKKNEGSEEVAMSNFTRRHEVWDVFFFTKGHTSAPRLVGNKQKHIFNQQIF